MLTVLKFIGIASAVIMAYAIIYETFINNPEKKAKKEGEKYEQRVVRAIKKFTGYTPIRNILIPHDYDDDVNEIDLALVTRKGIIIGECKHRTGVIHGNYDMDIWKIVNSSGDGTMENAFKQNEMHIDRFKKKILNAPHVFNVVFTSAQFTMRYANCKHDSDGKSYVKKTVGKGFKKVKDKEDFFNALFTDKQMAMVEVSELDFLAYNKPMKDFIKAMNSFPDVYTDKQVEEITYKIKQYEGTKEQRKAHAERVANLR